MLKRHVVPIITVLVFAFLVGCQGGLVAPVGGELTDKDIALDKYHQALRLSNNTIENLMANIKLLPAEKQAEWIKLADPIKQSIDTALAGWKLAINSENYEDMNANRAEFKRLKNELMDLLVNLSGVLG